MKFLITNIRNCDDSSEEILTSTAAQEVLRDIYVVENHMFLNCSAANALFWDNRDNAIAITNLNANIIAN